MSPFASGSSDAVGRAYRGMDVSLLGGGYISINRRTMPCSPDTMAVSLHNMALGVLGRLLFVSRSGSRLGNI